ncbi:hypothetical protein GOODEAATRI_027154 [Goodea atripinnis]|uniref:Uncharacterized protein n=1 Tax=Goodea atripinnis TaxID=208336 RepID=A0ABV0NY35_9TELE
MTAAASFRSRGVVVPRKYETLVVIITLLSLLCSASSWIGKDELQNIKENIQKLQEDAAMRRLDNKVDQALILVLLEDVTYAMHILTKIVLEMSPNRPLPIQQLKDMKAFLVESQDFMNKKFQNEAKKIKEYEVTLTNLETFVTNLGQEHAEL